MAAKSYKDTPGAAAGGIIGIPSLALTMRDYFYALDKVVENGEVGRLNLDGHATVAAANLRAVAQYAPGSCADWLPAEGSLIAKEWGLSTKDCREACL